MIDSDQGQQIHDVLTVTQTNVPSIRETWVIERGSMLLIAAQYVMRVGPPEPEREIHHDHDPVQAAISFPLAVTLAALGYRIKRRR
jgi:hypothetical protein